MTNRKYILATAAVVMVCVTALIMVTTTVILYQSEMSERRSDLLTSAQREAKVIEAAFEHASDAHHPGDHSQSASVADCQECAAGIALVEGILRESNQFHRNSGKGVEFVVARRDADTIHFLFSGEHSKDVNARGPLDVAWESELAEPMRLALSGRAGTIEANDYSGEVVLAAYAPVKLLKWGVVAKIDMSEMRAPFVNAAGKSLALAVLAIIVGLIGMRKRLRPLIQRLQDSERQLNETVVELRDASSVQESQDWLREGQASLTEQMRGEQEIAQLTRNIITHLARYVDAGVGAFYAADETRNLKLVASYAYRTRKNIANEFAFGEGLVGQAALEQEHILLTNVPDDYTAVNSGLGDTPPRNVLVWPIVREGQVKGVIELGTIETFDDRCVDLLGQVTENIAIALDVTQSRERLQQLLEESQAQSEELQAQTDALQSSEEELRHSNRDLAEKTAKLQASEETLQQQSEELQAANEELEEKTESLERQKGEVERAKQEVEEKAADVAMASKYKSEFLANMSHELRTPLNSLLILAKTLADNDEHNLTPEQVEMAEVIHHGGQELLTLINDILDLSKIEAGKLEVHIESVHLPALVDSLRSQFTPLAKNKGLTITTDLADKLPETLLTDGQKVEQVLRNLLSNATKFTKTGSVTLRVGRPDVDARFLHTDLTPDTAIAFSVIDTGIGISPDKQKVIFESFQQADGSTSRQYGGTGLGLPISREFAKLLGGEILLQSRPNEGSTFTLCLPLELISNTKAGTEQTTDAPGSTSKPPVSTTEDPLVAVSREALELEKVFLPDDRDELGPDDRTVLIVEDDKCFAQVLMDLCRKKQFKCLAVDTGIAALHLADEYKPSGILLDLGLPDMDGMAVLDELKQNLATRHIPVHIISARDKSNAALTKGAIGFLSKPVDSDDVMRVLVEVEKLADSTVKRLLVIEDDESTRQFIAENIQFKGVEITEAASGEEGYQKLLDGNFDCVILDLGLEDINGFELLQKLNEQLTPVPPVVAYSGHKLTAAERADVEAFGCSVVVKDTAAPELLADKVSLFLHSVESTLPEDQRRRVQMLHHPATRLQGKKVLLVDDDMRNTFALSKVLEKTGMTVLLAENGQLALDVLEQEEDIDLVLMDIMMPVMDGYEAMRRIRKNDRTAELPVIALTAKAMPEDRAKCVEAGANGYLTKPVDIDRLLSLIRVWILNHSVVCK